MYLMSSCQFKNIMYSIPLKPDVFILLMYDKPLQYAIDYTLSILNYIYFKLYYNDRLQIVKSPTIRLKNLLIQMVITNFMRRSVSFFSWFWLNTYVWLQSLQITEPSLTKFSLNFSEEFWACFQPIKKFAFRAWV